MEAKEIEKFKNEFKTIVYLQNSALPNKKRYIAQLGNWDKNGSHDKALVKACNQLDKLRNELTVKLKGRTYEEWLKFSNTLSKHRATIKRHENGIKHANQKIKDLKFL
jgi:hypothetical protein